MFPENLPTYKPATPANCIDIDKSVMYRDNNRGGIDANRRKITIITLCVINFLASFFFWRLEDEDNGIRFTTFCCKESKNWVKAVIKCVAELPQTANELDPNAFTIRGNTDSISSAGKITTNFAAQRRNMLWSVGSMSKFKFTLGSALFSKHSDALIPKMMHKEHVVIRNSAEVTYVVS